MGPQGPDSQLHPLHFMDTSWGGDGRWGVGKGGVAEIIRPASQAPDFPWQRARPGALLIIALFFSTWCPSVAGHGRVMPLILAIDIAITDIAPSPGRTWGQQQNVCHDRSCRLGLLSVVAILMTWHISLLKSSTVGVADDTHCTCIYDSVHVQVVGNGCARYSLSLSQH